MKQVKKLETVKNETFSSKLSIHKAIVGGGIKSGPGVALDQLSN